MNFKKTISAAVILFTVICSAVNPMGASAADSAITVSGGKALVGNGAAGVAVAASYDENGKLTKLVTKPVEKGGIAKLDVNVGDKVMFWDGLGTMKPLAESVTVTEDEAGDTDAIYEKAVQNALYEALGKNKGKGMTDLQKALALHDWLAINCQYDVTVSRPNVHKAYGAIVEGYAVCDGYAKAYNNLLARVGVKATYVEGRKPLNLGDNPQPHAWSCVTIGGKRYHVDVTADDPVPDTPGKAGRSHFLVSDDVLTRDGYVDYNTHCTDKTYENHNMFTGFYLPFIWDDDKQAFYYIDIDKAKTTTDFSETLTPSSNENGAKPSSMVFTNDGKYLCFFRPSFITSQSTVYLYSFETDEYYTYTISGIKDVVFCRVRQNGNNIEVVRDYYKNDMLYMVNPMVTLPLPQSTVKRSVAFDENYSGGKKTSCEYLNSCWVSGDGNFYEPKRDGFDFDGWYTRKSGGTKIESLDEIQSGNAVLYAHWWGAWKISLEPTMTAPGKAVRSIEGNAAETQEITIPNLSDTSVWTKKYTISASPEKEGEECYISEYGKVIIKLPKTNYEYGITYERGTFYATVAQEGDYFIRFESGDLFSERKMLSLVPGEYPTIYPKNFPKTGTVKVTLLDAEKNELCSLEYELK